MDPKLLQQQNQSLTAQLEQKRRENKVLEEKVAVYEQSQKDHELKTLCINRIWDQVRNDIQYMCSLVPGAEDFCIPDTTAALKFVKDPFLKRLLNSDPSAIKAVQTKQKAIQDELTEVDEVLQEQAFTTKEALTKLSTIIQGLQKKHDDALKRFASSSTDDVLRAEVERLTSEQTTMYQQLSGSKALLRASDEQLTLSEDRLLEAHEKIKRLQNELADTEQELCSLQRKYSKLASGEQAVLSANTPKSGESVRAFSDAQDEDGLGKELQDLRDALAKRTADYEKEREARAKTQRELGEAQARVSDESWVVSTALFKQARSELDAINTVLESKQKELETVMRERDDARQDILIKAQQLLAQANTKNEVSFLTKRVADLASSKAEADRAKQEFELALAREREKLGNTKTVAELHVLVGSLHREVNTLQEHVKKNKASAERIDAAVKEVAEAHGKLESKEVELARLTEKLKRKEQDIHEHKTSERVLRQRVGDLKAFTEVLTIYVDDARELTAVRASEASLRDTVDDLKGQLEGHELKAQIAALESSVSTANIAVEAAAKEADGLRLEISSLHRHIEEITSQLATARAECDTYIQEIEVTGSAYESMQSQNTRLLTQLTERDEGTNQLLAERIKLNQRQAELTEQLACAKEDVERAMREMEQATASKDALVKEMNRLNSELGALREQLRAAAVHAETLSNTLRAKESTVAEMSLQLKAVTASAEQRQQAADEQAEKAVKEKLKRQRLEEENNLLQKKVERYRKSVGQGAVAKELQDEVDAMRNLLWCNVCHQHQKNVIITKCWHMFCDKCIKRSLDSRQRKCPGCGTGFGQTDVKSFFFT